MYDLISIGDITVDFFFKGSSLTQKDNRFYLAIGGKYPVEHFYESLGGGGANVAVGAAHFRLQTAVLGKIGENAFKQMILQKLMKKTVSSELVMIEKDYLNVSSILLTDSGERTIIHYYTPHTHFSNDLIRQSLQTKAVYLGNLPGVSLQERIALLASFKKNGALICLNLGVKDCQKPIREVSPLFKVADIFILNTYEFAELVKNKKETIDFSKNCAGLIGYDKQILILTDGKNGSFGYRQQKIFSQKAIVPERIIDTTGAGDAYTSAFLASYLRNNDVPKAMHEGSRYAAVILGKIGAQ